MTVEYTQLVFTDGRLSCLVETLDSFDRMVSPEPARRIIIDDAADPVFAAELNQRYSDYEIVHHPARRGFCGAIQSGWLELGLEPWIVHVEDDFVVNRPVNLQDLVHVMDHDRNLAQMILRRQPWGAEEERAGGYVAMWPDLYRDEEWEGHHWLSHTQFWSTNLGIYRRSYAQLGWPPAPNGERAFTDHVLSLNNNVRFGIWGQREDAPWITHIGAQRAGSGY